MRCPMCGAAKLVHDTRDLPYIYKGETTVISAVAGDYCPACGESVLGASESARVSAAMLAFNRQVNSSMADPAFIANVRKKLALDQREAAGDLRGRRQCVLALRERQDQAPAGVGQVAQVAQGTGPPPRTVERSQGGVGASCGLNRSNWYDSAVSSRTF